jgi:hypothetical protein
MSQITRLNKLQRLRYLNPDNYLSGELCFWNDQLHDPKKYQTQVNEWIQSHKHVKQDLR